MSIILGIDPGYARCGWSVIGFHNYQLKYIKSGVIETENNIHIDTRLKTVHDGLENLINMYSPHYIGVEVPLPEDTTKWDSYHDFKTPTTFQNVCMVLGYVKYLSQKYQISKYEFMPEDIKKTTTGYGRCSKEHLIVEVKEKFGLGDYYIKYDDESDAIGVCYTVWHEIYQIDGQY